MTSTRSRPSVVPIRSTNRQRLGLNKLKGHEGEPGNDTLVAAGEQVDLAYLATTDLMNRVINGAALPLDEAITANGDNFEADYGGLSISAVTYNGGLYGVPRAGNTFKAFYNKTMADAN
ncbi:MAG: hypothetical protein LBK95_05650, partial [Bifidobacteriaceae bacterium]|nr:hypothetical protein [Bifidobacteriaceae bacterium]